MDDTASNGILISIGIAIVIACFLYICRNNYYKNRGEGVPIEINGYSIKYHYFVWYFLLPAWILTGIVDYAQSYELIGNVFPYNVLLFCEFVCVLLFIVAFIGFFKYTKLSFWSFIFGNILYILIFTTLQLMIYNSSHDMANFYGQMLVLYPLRVLSIIYYLKRKSLFTGKTSINLSNKIDNNMTTNDQNVIDPVKNITNTTQPAINFDNAVVNESFTTGIRYCRKCGAEMEEGTIFCRKCGTQYKE